MGIQGKRFFVDDNGYALTKAQRKERRPPIRHLDIPLAPVSFLTWDELQAIPVGDEWAFDVESYPNYWLCAFLHVPSGKVTYVEETPNQPLNVDFLSYMLARCLLIGFNSQHYDLTVISFALRNCTAADLWGITRRIIVDEEKPRDILRELGAWTPPVNHIDIKEVCPLDGSLKKYAARLHGKRLQDLPYPPGKELTQDEARNVLFYCVNDLRNTAMLYRELKDEIALRIELGKQYNLDLRSKSDAQIAEAIITREVAKINGVFPKRERVEAGFQFKFIPPEWMHFQTDAMQVRFAQICELDFEVTDTGYVQAPGLSEFEFQIGETVYKMGRGGLHSKEKTISYTATEDWLIVDDDVESYYPRLILNSGMFPTNMGKAFLTIYEQLVESRIADKKAKNTTGANSKKIVINGTFGKLGDRYSAMYSPTQLIQVTLTGQLALLMLIEYLEMNGIRVISANTDGIVKFVHRNQYARMREIIKQWEQITGLKTEETKYSWLGSRDINNYVAVKMPDEKGEVKIKGKGAYFDPRYDPKDKIFRFHKSPQHVICLKAIQGLLTKQIPIEQTIKENRDLSNFVTVREVKGGGHKDGFYLGKMVRWYYADDVRGTIDYILSGNKVPDSDGAKPCMDMPEEFPADINYQWYINRTNDMLRAIDFLPGARDRSLFDLLETD
jgi:hypothetical protein